MDIGLINVVVFIDDNGEEIIKVNVTGDNFPLITQLGALELARDSLLHPGDDDE